MRALWPMQISFVHLARQPLDPSLAASSHHHRHHHQLQRDRHWPGLCDDDGGDCRRRRHHHHHRHCDVNVSEEDVDVIVDFLASDVGKMEIVC